MPTQPAPRIPSYYRHNFDLGRWRLVELYENGEGLFEPITDHTNSEGIPRGAGLTPEAQRRRYSMAGMYAYFD